MRRLLVGGVCLGIVLTAAGCGPERRIGSPSGPSPATGDALTEHRQRWVRGAPTAYEFTLTYGSMVGTRSARIRVADGRVVSASPVEGQARFLPDSDKALTVDGVFDLLSSDMRRADRVRVTYSDTWGFPAGTSVDLDSQVIDEEYSYGVNDFVVLSP